MATTALKSKSRILIVAYGTEYLEVFSDTRDASVKIVNVPNFTSIKGELLIEELLTLRLPYTWSKVYRDGWLIDRDAIRDMQVDDICKRDEEIALIKTMNRIIESNMEVKPCRV